jgi:outer membrane protein assembly factor BamB
MEKKFAFVISMVLVGATILPVTIIPSEAGAVEHSMMQNENTFGQLGLKDVWPMYRHDPGNTGCSPYVAPNTNHLAWKHPIGDSVYHSTPVIYSDRLYISTNWYFQGEPPNISKIFTPPSPPDPRDILSCCRHEGSSGIYCLNAVTGEQLWFRAMDTPNDPAVFNEKIYVTTLNESIYDGSLYCLDARTGETIWQKPLGSLVLSPTIVADNKIYLGCLDLNSYSGSVKCYDLTGTLLWTYTLPSFEALWFSAPAVSGGNIYFIASDIYSYYTGNLFCLNAATGQFYWSHSIFSLGFFFFGSPSPACADGNVYVVDFNLDNYYGYLKCYEGSTGDLVWSCNLGMALSFASPAVSDDSVFITAFSFDNYNSWLYRINIGNGTVQWKTFLPSTSYLSCGSPICSADKVIVSPGTYYEYSNELFCYQRDDGTSSWQFLLDSETMGNPSLGNGRVYISDYTGTVYAIEDVLKIQAVLGGIMGVKAIIKNTGNATLTNISWSITVSGGAMDMIHQDRAGTIQTLAAKRSAIVRLLPIFGVGKVKIIARASLPQESTIVVTKQGLALGAMIITLP